ncbi:hypothetical protein P152DRAFT_225896 [Eremomyces bilateralis CBS 781.70]|uniref:Zn(2)-C6 fungal-type domain-containing protein n=1 Tax=Eremomyces bilateralis CBS 781.70 TaxID=1392243 RepID=A0A6G1FRH8_9PEZI|nr:uncharacterized protein P152DRAFT_225896 [Eremomyces bilateralis CBS 781.70]KAF1808291.1 hypothetical protein P152DRAFT_225896 [Eremomyces bilateralis CBS 781.70]
MDRQFRPLAPATGATPTATSTSPANSSRQSNRRRSIVKVACRTCQQKKAKCSGDRPSCTSCVETGISCHYDVEVGESSRYSSLKRKYGKLELEVEQFQELYRTLREQTERDASDILKRIRTTPDAIKVLHMVKQANYLLPNSVGAETNEQTQRLETVERDALRSSHLKVPAHPWTMVTEDGLVSSLISDFFCWDHNLLYSFVDKETFLKEMREGDPQNAIVCSPLLVNAICAERSVCLLAYALNCFTHSPSQFSSPHSKLAECITGKDTREAFFDEAKKLLDMEDGSECLSTVLGLAVLLVYAMYTGRDRLGSVYRYMAFDMLKRLKLEERFRSLGDTEAEMVGRRIISKALWGLHLLDTMISYGFLQPPILPPPGIPRPPLSKFETSSLEAGDHIDLFGHKFGKESPQPPQTPGIADSAYDLCASQFKIMKFNETRDYDSGSDEDISKRNELYRKLMEWKGTIPKMYKITEHVTPHTVALHSQINEVAVSILRPLPSNTWFEDLDGGSTIKDLCIIHAISSIEGAEKCIKIWSPEHYACAFFSAPYNAALHLTPWLNDERTHGPFTQACNMLSVNLPTFPVIGTMLRGIYALVWTLKQNVPDSSRPYFQNLDAPGETVKDVPLSLFLPQFQEVRGRLAGGPNNNNELSGQLGNLISRWNALTIL